MEIESFSFGAIRIDGVTYDDDVVIDGGMVHKRDKKPSRKFRHEYGHTPVSLDEQIPWNCSRLVIGTGVDGKLPVRPEVRIRAESRNVELLIVPTAHAIEKIQQGPAGRTNAILHITC